MWTPGYDSRHRVVISIWLVIVSVHGWRCRWRSCRKGHYEGFYLVAALRGDCGAMVVVWFSFSLSYRKSTL